MVLWTTRLMKLLTTSASSTAGLRRSLIWAVWILWSLHSWITWWLSSTMTLGMRWPCVTVSIVLAFPNAPHLWRVIRMICTKSPDPIGELFTLSGKFSSFFEELSICERTATNTESRLPKTFSADSLIFLKKVTESRGTAPDAQADSDAERSNTWW